MAFSTRITDELGLAVPIIQAPMLGATGKDIVVAVSQAGGLGSLAAAGLGHAALREQVAQIRAVTKAPFNVNLLIVEPVSPPADVVARALERLKPWRRELGLADQAIPDRWSENYRDQLDALIELGPPAVSFTFGCLTRDQITALKARGSFIIGTATTVAEARAWEAVGADAVCAQGFEAGGHRGTFLAPVEESVVGIFCLLPAIRAAISIPLVAAGGIMDGRGVAAALLLGAEAVQLGTAFMLTPEAITPQPWRDAIRSAGDDSTRLTRAFSGKVARGIENRFMREMRAVEHDIPAYPIQNALTSELRAAAAKSGSSDQMSLWAGQGARSAREMPAGELVAVLWREALEAIESLHRRLDRH